MYDEHGTRFLDLVNNVCHVGHCHPIVTKAASLQFSLNLTMSVAANQLAVLNSNTRYLHQNLVLYAQRLASLFPAPLSVVYFTCSGRLE